MHVCAWKNFLQPQPGFQLNLEFAAVVFTNFLCVVYNPESSFGRKKHKFRLLWSEYIHAVFILEITCYHIVPCMEWLVVIILLLNFTWANGVKSCIMFSPQKHWKKRIQPLIQVFFWLMPEFLLTCLFLMTLVKFKSLLKLLELFACTLMLPATFLMIF